MDAIFQRCSVRHFLPNPVSIKDIEQLTKAAMAAPSAGNQQPWEFYIVRDETTREALSTISPYAEPAKTASCVIVACMRTADLRFPNSAPYDMSAAVENILLEAAHLGLGAVWLGVAPDDARMSAVDAALGGVKGVKPFALVAVGYPASQTDPKGASRYDETRVHWM